MTYSITHKVRLHNGVEMPQFGLGVYKVEEGKEAVDTVKQRSILDIGRLIPRLYMETKRVLERELKRVGFPAKSFLLRQRCGIRIKGMSQHLLHLKRA